QEYNGVNPSILLRPSNSYRTIFLIADHILHVRAKLTTKMSQFKGSIILLLDASIQRLIATESFCKNRIFRGENSFTRHLT
ncbi:MAG: hypothetical protein ACRD8Z_21065, partial [Nitrososphaeraceae archaeon]